MPEPFELLLGKICVEKGWLKPEQLQECLAASPSERLSDLLVRKRFVPQSRLEELRTEVGRLLARGEYRVVRKEDELIGQILFQRGAITDEQLRQALRTQKSESRHGDSVPRLGEILLQMGALSYATLEEALREQSRATWTRCGGCGMSYGIPRFDPGKSYLCRKCGGTVRAPADGAAEPAEVREARSDPKRRLGKYVLVRELGRGGMGVVYQAWDAGLRRWVALKLLSGQDQPDELSRFQREAQTAASLKHPNIVGIFEVGREGERHFIAMEYVDGSTLAGHRLPVRKAVEILALVARAVDFAHSKGVLHRDLKPQNILLDREGKPVVMDFGLAKNVRGESQLTMSGTIIGTPSYMPPEQAEGKIHRLDRRCDIYSLGAVLYEMLTGRPPFRGGSPLETLSQVVHAEPKPPSSLNGAVPADMETVVLKCLEKDRSRRYPSARLLAEDLERWLKGDAILARRSSVAVMMSRRLRKNRAGWIAGSVAAAVAILLVVFLVERSANRESDRKRFLRDAEEAKRGREKRVAEEAAAKVRKEREDRDRKARNDAQPYFDEGRRELTDATRELYRSTADLSALDRKLQKTAAHFTQALETFPQFAEAHYHRGLVHFFLRRYDEAEADFGRAIELQSGFSDAYYERARLRLERATVAWGRARRRASASKQAETFRAGAREDLLEFRRLGGGGSRWADYAEALLAFSENRVPQAREICEKLAGGRTTDEQIYKLLGDLREMEAKPAESEEAYTRAIELRANYFEAYLMRGNVRLVGGNVDGALADFTRAIAIHPRFADAFVNRGAAHYQKKHPAEARHDFEEALRIDPRAAEAYDNLGVLSYDEKDFPTALHHLNRSLAIDAENPVAYLNRGAVKRWMNDLDGALEDYGESLKRNPDQAGPYFNRALIYELRREWDDCVRDTTAFLDRYAKKDVNRERGFFLRAHAYEQMRKFREAIADWEKCLELETPRRAEVEARIREAKKKMAD